MLITILGWVATVTLLVGYVLNAKKYISSWLVWMLGNTMMSVYGLAIQSYSLVFLSVVLVGLNVYGLASWRRDS